MGSHRRAVSRMNVWVRPSPRKLPNERKSKKLKDQSAGALEDCASLGESVLVSTAAAAASSSRLSRISRFACCRSEEHTSELQSLMRISYAVFCLKTKKNKHKNTTKQGMA